MNEKKLWLNLQRIVDKRGRTGKKLRGDTLQGDDTQVKSIKVTVMSKSGRQILEEKNRSDTVSFRSG